MAWVNVGNIKGDTGDTGPEGAPINVYKDTAHEVIYIVGEDTEITIAFSEIKGDTGPKGDTGDSGSITIDSTLDTTSNNAIQNSAVATAIEDLQDDIGTIITAQQNNLTLLGS